MSTAAEKGASPSKAATVALPAPVVLHGVDYRTYRRLRRTPANGDLRMIYHDGVLEIMSPEFIHDQPTRRLGVLVSVLCEELEIEFEGVRSTTFCRGEPRERKGQGKEPDEAFYFANAAKTLGKKRLKLDEVPPPDLWIEVDNRGSSVGKLPLYAALGVPEVWRYRVASKRIRFLRRTDDGTTFDPIERSLALPMLTPALVVEALALGENMLEGSWTRALRACVRAKFLPAAEG